jgi:hypothetical protein
MRRILLAAPITLDLLEFERQAFIDEILKRTRLLFGEVDPTLNRYGIVDSRDPRTALSSDTTRPLVVSVNVTDPATIDVSPGTAVFQSGEVIVLENGASRIAVPGGIGTKSVVFLKFDELELGPRLTRYETLANTYVDFLESDADYIQVLTRNDYDALSFEEKALTIPLAFITVQEVVVSGGGGTTTELVVDMTQDQLSTNRSWFTPVDIEHRSFVGSGVVSSSNPHGMSLNDVAASSAQTLFQLHLDHGMIVSKDRDLAKVPGKICEETILAGAISVDTTGSVTGILNALFFETTKFPTQLLRCTDAATKTFDFAPVQLPRKNVVFLLPNDQYVAGTDLTIYYMSTDAAEPPTGVPLTSLVFKQPVTLETLISGGFVVESIVNLEFTFEDASPIPQRFIIYLDRDGFFQRYPQTCGCYKRLTDIGFTLQTFDQALRGTPARLKVGLQNAVPGATLNVQVQITGKDSSGAIVTETVTFDSTWVNNVPGTCSEEDQQFRYTNNEFASITNYIVTNNVDSGPDASIAIFGDITPEATSELADILPVVEVVWDGLQVCSLEDIRPINTSMHLPTVTKHAAGAMALAEGTLIYRPGFLFNFWVDDFNQPKFISTQWTDNSTSPALDPSSTKMRKIFDGLDRFDTYVGRPMAVRPHDSNPVAIRFTPIEPDRDFQLFARYFDGSGAWSDWRDLGGFVLPNYSIDLTTTIPPLIKWQVIVSGQCKGLITTYVTDGPGLGAAAFVFDVGVWDNGSFT